MLGMTLFTPGKAIDSRLMAIGLLIVTQNASDTRKPDRQLRRRRPATQTDKTGDTGKQVIHLQQAHRRRARAFDQKPTTSDIRHEYLQDDMHCVRC